MSAVIKGYTWQIKAAIGLAILVIAAILFGLWLHNRDDKKELKGTANQAVATGQATTRIAGQASDTQASTQRVVVEAEAQQVEILHRYEAIRDANPQVRAFGDTPIPPELRDIARSARLARERLGCSEAGCPADDAAASGARKGDAP